MKRKVIDYGVKVSQTPILGKIIYQIGKSVQKKLKLRKEVSINETVIHMETLSREDTTSIEAQNLLEEINSDSVFYDIGACKGIYSIAGSNKSPEADIFAFEPEEENSERIKKLKIINDSNVNIIDKCVGDKDGKVDFYTHKSANGIHTTSKESLESFSSDNQIKQYEVEMTTVDTLLENESIPLPTLVKIDVEGAEVDVLKGARETIKTSKPAILVEYHEDKIGCFNSDLEGLKKILDELGYQYKFIDDIHIMARPNEE